MTTVDKPLSVPNSQIVVENWPMGLEATREQLAKTRRRLEQYRGAIRLASAEVQQRNRGIVALTNFAYQGGRLATPTALLRLVLAQALAVVDAPVGAIVLINPETKELTLGVHKGLTVDLKNILTGHQLDNGAMTLMPHLVAGKGALVELQPDMDEAEQWLLETNKLTSLVSLPLQSGSRLMGALLTGSQNGKYFTPAELCFLMAMSQEAAIILENLRLREGLWFTAETLLGVELTDLDLSKADQSEADLSLSEVFDLPAVMGNEAKPVAQDVEQLLMATVDANEKVKQQNADLQTLNTIAEMMNRTLNLTEILQRTVAQTKIALHTDAAWLYLLGKDGVLDLKAHTGLSMAYTRGMQRLKAGEGIDGLVLLDKAPHFVASVAKDKHKHKIWVDKEGLLALAAVPITRPDSSGQAGPPISHVIGVLGVGHHAQPGHHWSPREIRLLTAIANQVAPAIDNALLYAQVQEGEAGLKAGNEILRAINDMLLEKNAFFEGFIQEDMIIALNSALQILQRLTGDELNQAQKYEVATLEEIVDELMVLARESEDVSSALDSELETVADERGQHKPIRLAPPSN
ncbi:MAG: GAF domain-containing protein [Anaerolineae bacterium]|nr:GAF domain-containing protein [Anaerolineae bacterium]